MICFCHVSAHAGRCCRSNILRPPNHWVSSRTKDSFKTTMSGVICILLLCTVTLAQIYSGAPSTVICNGTMGGMENGWCVKNNPFSQLPKFLKNFVMNSTYSFRPSCDGVEPYSLCTGMVFT